MTTLRAALGHRLAILALLGMIGPVVCGAAAFGLASLQPGDLLAQPQSLLIAWMTVSVLAIVPWTVTASWLVFRRCSDLVAGLAACGTGLGLAGVTALPSLYCAFGWAHIAGA